MIYIFYGTDEFQTSQELSSLKKELDDGMLDSNTTILQGRGLTAEILIQNIMAIPFLSSNRLVIVEGLIAALGSRKGTLEKWTSLLELLPTIPSSNHLVFIELPTQNRENTSRSPLFKEISQLDNVNIIESKELKNWSFQGQSELEHWIQLRAQEKKIDIENDAIKSIIELMGANLRSIDNELDKLKTFVRARSTNYISVNDTTLLTPMSKDENLFNLVDSIVEGNISKSFQLMHNILNSGKVAPSRIVSLISRQTRLMIRTAELLEQGTEKKMIGDNIGVRANYPLDKIIKQTKNSDLKKIISNLRYLELTDSYIKQGKMTEQLGLELIICNFAVKKTVRAS
ncbi:MAG: DNA polymerase III subunit delta [Chloroflexi bacterium]|nr:DNA polymerase III subunit delta [Chloroflexota bacterium]